MGQYAVDKELFNKLSSQLEDLEKASPDRDNAKTYDNLRKRLGILEKRLSSYGVGWVHRVSTSHGDFYLVNVDDEDLPDLLRDMGLKSWLVARLDSHKILKSGKSSG